MRSPEQGCRSQRLGSRHPASFYIFVVVVLSFLFVVVVDGRRRREGGVQAAAESGALPQLSGVSAAPADSGGKGSRTGAPVRSDGHGFRDGGERGEGEAQAALLAVDRASTSQGDQVDANIHSGWQAAGDGFQPAAAAAIIAPRTAGVVHRGRRRRQGPGAQDGGSTHPQASSSSSSSTQGAAASRRRAPHTKRGGVSVSYSPLPSQSQARALSAALSTDCYNGPVAPPRRVAVVGLHGSGVEHVRSFLGEHLTTEVSSRVPDSWEYDLPSHDPMAALLKACLKQSAARRTVFVVVVRHPLAWLQALLAEPTGAALACRGKGWELQRCWYGPCIRNEICSRKDSWGYRLAAPADLWGSYASHLPPTNTRNIYVLRFEDFLHHPLDIARNIAKNFDLEVAPGPHQNLPAALTKLNDTWNNFSTLWAKDFSTTDDSMPATTAEVKPSPNAKVPACPIRSASQRQSLIFPRTVSALGSSGLPVELTEKYGYHLPSVDRMKSLWRICGDTSVPASLNKPWDNLLGVFKRFPMSWNMVGTRPPPLQGVHGLMPYDEKLVRLKALSVEPPSLVEMEALARNLSQECARVAPSDRLPPRQLAIAGMPNTGTNALTNFLAGSLNVSVRGEPSDTIWKHRLPFHPSFHAFMLEQCRSRQDWVGLVFLVRHPITWLQSQTSVGHSYGHECIRLVNGTEACSFSSCDIHNPGACKDNLHGPEKYMFPTLLDVWASFASALPVSLPTVYVVRYEDLLADSSAVLDRVSRHFGLRVDAAEVNPLIWYSRQWDTRQSSSGLEESQHRFRSFAHFWQQFGVNAVGRIPSDTSAAVIGPDQVQCPEGDASHQLVDLYGIHTLNSTQSRGSLVPPLARFQYEVPTTESAVKAWNACSGRMRTGRVIPNGLPELMAVSGEFPRAPSRERMKSALATGCEAKPKSKRRSIQSHPASKISVLGLPNSGVEEVIADINGALGIAARTDFPGMFPSPNDFHRVLRQSCIKQHPWAGIVLLVRHPMAWMQAQLSDPARRGEACAGTPGGRPVCFFKTCDDRASRSCQRNGPSLYVYDNLLEVWAGWADMASLPLLPAVHVLRYEDYLEDRMGALSAISESFGLPFLQANGTSAEPPADGRHPPKSWADDSRRWHAFRTFWERMGTNPGGKPNDTAKPQPPPSSIVCPSKENPSPVAFPEIIRAMASLAKHETSAALLETWRYQIPPLEVAERVWEGCGSNVDLPPLPPLVSGASASNTAEQGALLEIP